MNLSLIVNSIVTRSHPVWLLVLLAAAWLARRARYGRQATFARTKSRWVDPIRPPRRVAALWCASVAVREVDLGVSGSLLFPRFKDSWLFDWLARARSDWRAANRRPELHATDPPRPSRIVCFTIA